MRQSRMVNSASERCVITSLLLLLAPWLPLSSADHFQPRGGFLQPPHSIGSLVGPRAPKRNGDISLCLSLAESTLCRFVFSREEYLDAHIF